MQGQSSFITIDGKEKEGILKDSAFFQNLFPGNFYYSPATKNTPVRTLRSDLEEEAFKAFYLLHQKNLILISHRPIKPGTSSNNATQEIIIHKYHAENLKTFIEQLREHLNYSDSLLKEADLVLEEKEVYSKKFYESLQALIQNRPEFLPKENALSPISDASTENLNEKEPANPTLNRDRLIGALAYQEEENIAISADAPNSRRSSIITLTTSYPEIATQKEDIFNFNFFEEHVMKRLVEDARKDATKLELLVKAAKQGVDLNGYGMLKREWDVANYQDAVNVLKQAGMLFSLKDVENKLTEFDMMMQPNNKTPEGFELIERLLSSLNQIITMLQENNFPLSLKKEVDEFVVKHIHEWSKGEIIQGELIKLQDDYSRKKKEEQEANHEQELSLWPTVKATELGNRKEDLDREVMKQLHTRFHNPRTNETSEKAFQDYIRSFVAKQLLERFEKINTVQEGGLAEDMDTNFKPIEFVQEVTRKLTQELGSLYKEGSLQKNNKPLYEYILSKLKEELSRQLDETGNPDPEKAKRDACVFVIERWQRGKLDNSLMINDLRKIATEVFSHDFAHHSVDKRVLQEAAIVQLVEDLRANRLAENIAELVRAQALETIKVLHDKRKEIGAGGASSDDELIKFAWFEESALSLSTEARSNFMTRTEAYYEGLLEGVAQYHPSRLFQRLETMAQLLSGLYPGKLSVATKESMMNRYGLFNQAERASNDAVSERAMAKR